MRKIVTVGIIAAVSALALTVVPAALNVQASDKNNNAKECKVTSELPNRGKQMTDFKGQKKNFATQNGRAYITAVVTGENCKEPVTLASWTTPSKQGTPYRDQKLQSHVTKVLREGKTTFSIPIPDCYYQLDLVRGKDPRGKHGGGAYQEGRIIHGIIGGTTKCNDKPEKPEVPETPETPETPKTPEEGGKGGETPAELPQTGAEDVFGLAGAAALTASTGYYVASRRRS